MAFGLDTSGNGGVMSSPVIPGLGDDQWAAMSGMHPGNALAGYGGQRRISTVPNQPAAIAGGNPSFGHWSQLFNLKSNPTGWVLILALCYLALHVQLGGSLGLKAGYGRK